MYVGWLFQWHHIVHLFDWYFKKSEWLCDEFSKNVALQMLNVDGLQDKSRLLNFRFIKIKVIHCTLKKIKCCIYPIQCISKHFAWESWNGTVKDRAWNSWINGKAVAALIPSYRQLVVYAFTIPTSLNPILPTQRVINHCKFFFSDQMFKAWLGFGVSFCLVLVFVCLVVVVFCFLIFFFCS